MRDHLWAWTMTELSVSGKQKNIDSKFRVTRIHVQDYAYDAEYMRTMMVCHCQPADEMQSAVFL